MNWILPQFEVLEMNFLLNFEDLRLKIYDLGVKVESWLLGTEKFWNEGLGDSQDTARGCKKGVSSGPHIPVSYFLGSSHPQAFTTGTPQ